MGAKRTLGVIGCVLVIGIGAVASESSQSKANESPVFHAVEPALAPATFGVVPRIDSTGMGQFQ